jgi:hypothetical protein
MITDETRALAAGFRVGAETLVVAPLGWSVQQHFN